MSATAQYSLAEMLTALRSEVGHSTNPAFGLNDRASMIYLLNRTQLDLWESYDWEFLHAHAAIPLVPAVRFYNFPPAMRFEDVNEVWFADGTDNTYQLEYGIGPRQYAYLNSFADPPATSWPPRRWSVTVATSGTAPTMEVWPIPDASSTTANLIVRGTQVPQNMVNDGDLATLPWRIIVLSAAAEVLASEQDPTSQVKSQRATELLRRFKVRQNSHKSGTTSLVGQGQRRHPRVGLDFIPNGYGSGPSRI